MEKEDQKALDDNQENYRKKFGIIDKYLIGYSYDPNEDDSNGYIVFIDYKNDLDYVDCREIESERKKEQNRWIARLQYAEATQCNHLPETQQMDFKRMLGAGYLLALEGNFEEIDNLINEAKDYLKKRNKEYSRRLFLWSGLPATLIAGVLGLVLYWCHVNNPWYFGFIFGIFGAFVSIWMRYGNVQFTGQAQTQLHILECYSRLFIGTIFAVVAMIAIHCKLILPQFSNDKEIYVFTIVGFIAGFSERLIPSIVEQISNKAHDNSKIH